MVVELHHPHARLDVPEHTRHIARARHNLAIVDKPTAAQIARMRTELARALVPPALLVPQIVDRADIVQPAARDKVPARGVCAGHDPGAAQRDRVDFVRRVRVPDDEFAVLGGRDEVALVRGPVHRVDLCEVAFERAARAHDDAGEGLEVFGHGAHCENPTLAKIRGVKRGWGGRTGRVGGCVSLCSDSLFEGLGLSSGGGHALLDVALGHVGVGWGGGWERCGRTVCVAVAAHAW